MSDDRVAVVLKHIDETTAWAGRTENDRWWQAFCSAPATFRPAQDAPEDYIARLCANFADDAISEAKKRGRL